MEAGEKDQGSGHHDNIALQVTERRCYSKTGLQAAVLKISQEGVTELTPVNLKSASRFNTNEADYCTNLKKHSYHLPSEGTNVRHPYRREP